MVRALCTGEQHLSFGVKLNGSNFLNTKKIFEKKQKKGCHGCRDHQCGGGEKTVFECSCELFKWRGALHECGNGGRCHIRGPFCCCWGEQHRRSNVAIGGNG